MFDGLRAGKSLENVNQKGFCKENEELMSTL